jgi:hypothetical protein
MAKLNNATMTKLVSVDRRIEPFNGKYTLEIRLDIDGRPYVKVERYQHAEDADERAIVIKVCPEIVIG